MDKKRICALCGNELKRTKGQNKKAHEYEVQHGAHVFCLRTHEAIMRTYRISGNDYLKAVVDGLFLLFPELEETKSVKDYNSRAKKAKEEIEEKFPYLKEIKKKGEEVKEKNAVAKKEEDAEDIQKKSEKEEMEGGQ